MSKIAAVQMSKPNNTALDYRKTYGNFTRSEIERSFAAQGVCIVYPDVYTGRNKAKHSRTDRQKKA
jgi:hypothetical protein